MNIQEHKELTGRTWNEQGKDTNILHATLLITSEAGELASAVKKKVGYGKEIDVVNIKEELGDLIYGIQRLMIEFGLTWEEVCQSNIDKLKARFPEKFTQEHATTRDLEKEREVLERP